MSDSWDGIERRTDRTDLAYALSAIGERLKGLEEKFSLKVEHISSEVDELKEEDADKHLAVEKKIYQRLTVEFQKISSKLDIISSFNASVNLSMQKLDSRVDNLESRIDAVESAAKNRVYQIFTQIVSKLGWVVLGVLGAAILFAVTQAQFWDGLLKK